MRRCVIRIISFDFPVPEIFGHSYRPSKHLYGSERGPVSFLDHCSKKKGGLQTRRGGRVCNLTVRRLILEGANAAHEYYFNNIIFFALEKPLACSL